jgi:hypothetical protein
MKCMTISQRTWSLEDFQHPRKRSCTSSTTSSRWSSLGQPKRIIEEFNYLNIEEIGEHEEAIEVPTTAMITSLLSYLRRLSSVVCRLSSVVCRLSSVVCRLSSVVDEIYFLVFFSRFIFPDFGWSSYLTLSHLVNRLILIQLFNSQK